MRGVQKRNKIKKQVEKVLDRNENLADGEQKKILTEQEIKKARARPLSVHGKKALRELETQKTGPKTFSDFIIKKAEEKGLKVPTNREEARKHASNKLRATPCPTAFWLSQQ